MSSCFSMGRYIAQQVAAEQRDAVSRRVRDMFPEINLPPAPAPAPARAPAPAPAPAPALASSSSLGRYAAPSKHVVSAAQPSTSALNVSPLTPPLVQLYKGFIYTSAHVRDVDGRTVIEDGDTPVGIDAGFKVAPGDASDIEVANAHAWGSDFLIFSDGAYTGSALFPSHGIASYFCK
jgi:hypothetical protein